METAGSSSQENVMAEGVQVKYKNFADDLERKRGEKFPSQINIVMFGKQGVGKSTLGNSLLKRTAFKSERKLMSVTKECSVKTSQEFLRQKEVTLRVIDTPGLADTSRPTHDLMNSIFNCMQLAEGKVHIFMILYNVATRVTDEEKQAIKIFKDRFGENSEKFIMIILTHTDEIPDSYNLTDWISDSPFMKETKAQYGNRFCEIGEGPNKKKDVNNMYDKISQMIEENNYEVYDYHLFLATKQTFRKERELRKEIEDKIRKEIEDKIRKEVEDKIRMEMEDQIKTEMETEYRMTNVERTSNPTQEDKSTSKESD